MKQQEIAKSVMVGVVVGLIATAIGASVWILALSETDYSSTIKNAYQQRHLGAIMAAGALVNIACFFLFLKQQKVYQARGVMIATLMVAVFVIIQKFG